MCKITGVNVTIKPKIIGIHETLNEIQLTVIVVLLFTLGWVQRFISGHVYLNIVSAPKLANQILVVNLIEVFVFAMSL